MDMRRSGVVEAIAGDAGPLGLSAKLANSIERPHTMHKTNAPVDIEAVRSADAARLKGRRRMPAVPDWAWDRTIGDPRRRVRRGRVREPVSQLLDPQWRGLGRSRWPGRYLGPRPGNRSKADRRSGNDTDS